MDKGHLPAQKSHRSRSVDTHSSKDVPFHRNSVEKHGFSCSNAQGIPCYAVDQHSARKHVELSNQKEDYSKHHQSPHHLADGHKIVNRGHNQEHIGNKNAKSTIDTSCPKGFTFDETSHRSNSIDMGSLKAAHYPFHSYGIKKHDCSHSSAGSVHERSHSTPSRPVTRRHPADMPDLKEGSARGNSTDILHSENKTTRRSLDRESLKLPKTNIVLSNKHVSTNGKFKPKDAKYNGKKAKSLNDSSSVQGQGDEVIFKGLQESRKNGECYSRNRLFESKQSCQSQNIINKSIKKDEHLSLGEDVRVFSNKEDFKTSKEIDTLISMQQTANSLMYSPDSPGTKNLCEPKDQSGWCHEECVYNMNRAANQNKMGYQETDTFTNAFEHEYLQFSLRITEDIIRNDLYTNNEMRRVFNSHIEANRGRLNMEKMKQQIKELSLQLNIPYDEQFIDANCRENVNKAQETLRRMCECKKETPDTPRECECGSVRCLPYSCIPSSSASNTQKGEIVTVTLEPNSSPDHDNEIGTTSSDQEKTKKDDVKTKHPKSAKHAKRKSDAHKPKPQDTPRSTVGTEDASKPKEVSTKKGKHTASKKHNKADHKIKDEDAEINGDTLGTNAIEEYSTHCCPTCSKKLSMSDDHPVEDDSEEQKISKQTGQTHHTKKSTATTPTHAGRKKTKNLDGKSDDESSGAKEANQGEKVAHKRDGSKKSKKGTKGHTKHKGDTDVTVVNSLANEGEKSQFDVCVGESCNIMIDVAIEKDNVKHGTSTCARLSEPNKSFGLQTAVGNDPQSKKNNFFDENTSEIYTLFPCGMAPNILQTNRDDGQYFMLPGPMYIPKTTVTTGTCSQTYQYPNTQLYTAVDQTGKNDTYSKFNEKSVATKHCTTSCNPRKVYTPTDLPPTEIFYTPPKMQKKLDCQGCRTNIMRPEKEYMSYTAKRNVCTNSTCKRARNDLLLSNEYESGLPPSIMKFFPSISTQTNSSDFLMIDKIMEANRQYSANEDIKPSDSGGSPYVPFGSDVYKKDESRDSFEENNKVPVIITQQPTEITENIQPSENTENLLSPSSTENVQRFKSIEDETDQEGTGKDQREYNVECTDEDVTDEDNVDDEMETGEDDDANLNETEEIYDQQTYDDDEQFKQVDEDNALEDEAAIIALTDIEQKSSMKSDSSNDDDFMKKLDYKPKMDMTPSMETRIKKVQHDSEVFRRPEERRISWGGEAGIDISVGVTTVIEEDEEESQETDDDAGNVIDDTSDFKKKSRERPSVVMKGEDVKYFASDESEETK